MGLVEDEPDSRTRPMVLCQPGPPLPGTPHVQHGEFCGHADSPPSALHLLRRGAARGISCLQTSRMRTKDGGPDFPQMEPGGRLAKGSRRLHSGCRLPSNWDYTYEPYA